MAFGDVAFQICENGVFKEKNVRLNSAGCEPHSRSDECFLFENPIFTLLKRHVRKRHVYRFPTFAGSATSQIGRVFSPYFQVSSFSELFRNYVFRLEQCTSKRLFDSESIFGKVLRTRTPENKD